MADKKISQLTSLAQGDIATTTDVLAIVDTSATETKKATPAAIVGAAAAAGLTNVDINSGAIDGTTIGANSAAAGTFTNLTASGTVSFSGATVSNGGSVTTVDINGGTIDGASVGASSASSGAFTTLSASGNLTLSGGTANGVLYLNGSKVATSGSDLNFNGTNVGIGGSGDPFGRFYGRSVGLTSGSSAFLEINAATGSTSGIDFGVNASRTAGITSNTTQTTLSTLTATPLVFEINGSEQARLTSTGLGIGTSSPGSKLDVSGGIRSTSWTSNNVGINANPLTGTSTSAQNLRFLTTGSDFYIGTEGSTGGGFYPGSTAYAAVLYNANATPIQFWTSGTLRATLDSSGNLGIGTSSPTYKLHLVGKQIIEKSGAGYEAAMLSFATITETGAIYRMGMASGGAFIIGRSDTATTNLTLDVSGNLGLGVTPSAWVLYTALQIKDSAISAIDNNQVVMSQNGAYTSGPSWKYINSNYASYYQQYQGQHRWYNAPSGTAGNAISFTQAMTLDASGNLGVGTSSPGSKLDVRGVITGGDGTIQTVISYLASAGVTGTLSNHPYVFYANNAERARIDASGNFGIGTTGPVNKLSVLGKISASDSNFTASAYIHASPDSGADRAIGQFSVAGASNGLQINWNHASSKMHIIINNIPTSSAGLPSGTLYSDGGTIKIA